MTRAAVGFLLFALLSLAGFTPFALQAWRNVGEQPPKFQVVAVISAFLFFVFGSLFLGTLREERERKNPPKRARGKIEGDFTADSRVRTGVILLVIWTPIAFGGSWLLLRKDLGFWGFVLFMLAGEAAIISRLRYVIRMRHLADPVVDIQGDTALVRLTTLVPLRRFAIDVEVDGVRSTLYEKENVSGAISERVDVEESSALIVVQTTESGDIETTFEIP